MYLFVAQQNLWGRHDLAVQQDEPSAAVGLVIVLGVILLGLLYFAPTAVATLRHVPDLAPIIVINILLGWTLFGWVAALAMAVRSLPSPQSYPYQRSRIYPYRENEPPRGPRSS